MERIPQPQRKTARYCFAAVLAFFSAALGRVPAFEFGFLEQELRQGTRNNVEFVQIADTPIVYRTWGVWNIRGTASEAADVALDFYNYPSIFRHVFRCEPIMAPKSRISPLGTWYVEGRAAMARVWSIGDIETLQRSDSFGVRLFARQNEDRYLEATWSRSDPGWINYRTYGVQFAAFIVAVGADSCRVGVVAQGIVKQAMPKWLTRMAIKIILPRFMDDLQREVKRRIDLKKPKQPPWYGRWLEGMRRLF